jgi:putative restriction endonuclease
VGFAVFVHRPDSGYDDRPDEQYQFPRQYLSRAERCVGDWIVYLEPRRVPGARGYFATAKVAAVVPDPGADKMYLALMEPGSYLPFAHSVPFNGMDGVLERGVLNENGRNSGRAQAAVRPLSPQDFSRIVDRGLSDVDTLLPRVEVPTSAPGFSDVQQAFDDGSAEDRLRQLTSRIVRDRVFRRVVLRAYGERCAMTGLKLINGGGRAEAEAAHIQAVEAKGPDIVSNGIALSGTMHWMFDRGLVSLGDDHTILVSRQVNDPEAIHGLLNRSGRITLPARALDHPHARFLRWHRESRFKA